MTNKRAIFVLGMHRSGTSALAGVLAALGVTMPRTLMPAHPTNPKGFFESYAIMNLSDEMLREGGGAWDDWRSVNLSHLEEGGFNARIAEVFLHEFGGEPPIVAIKDPRHCRLAPLWLGAVENLGYSPLAVLPFRHPLEVAQSMAARDSMPVAQGLLIWLRHVLDAEYFTRGLPRAFVHMPDLLADWRRCVDVLAGLLDIEWPIDPDEVTKTIDGFLDRDLKNHTVSDEVLDADPMTRGWVRKTFAAMSALVRTPDSEGVMAELDAIRLEFDLAADVFGPVLSGIEKRNRTLEQEKAGLVAENGSLRHGLEHQRREVDNRKVENRILVDRLAVEVAQIGALRERASLVDGLVPEIEVLRARAAALDNDVVHLHAGLVAAEAHRQALDTECEALRSILSATQQKVADLEQALAAQTVDLETHVSDLAVAVHSRDCVVADLEHALCMHAEAEHRDAARLEAISVEMEAVEALLKAYRDAGRLQYVNWALGKARP